MASRKRATAVLGFGAIAFLAACSGKIVDIGSQSTESQLLPSAVTVATSECSTGYAHSNVCCTGGDSTSTPSCVTWLDDPFHPCPSGYTTYPNANECCSLDNPADCSQCSAGTDDAGTPDGVVNGPSSGGDTPVANPSDPNGATGMPAACGGTVLPEPADGGTSGGGGTVSACDPRCPPGYTGVSPYDPQGCCQFDATGSSGTCFGEARADGTGSGVPDDAGVNPGGPEIDASTPDAGTDGGFKDGGTPVDGGTDGGFKDGGSSVDAGYYDGGGGSGYDPGAVCGFTCPDGWFTADVAAGVCCSNDKDGNEQCFAVVFPDDNGGGGGVDPGGPMVDAGAPTPVGD
ncbi:MAG TPA: hypothetical protein VF407_16180 [Polyangiaceae bacterium]